MKKKKVAIVGTNGIPANYGGFETLAENLVDNLNKEFKFIVYCSNKQTNRLKSFKGAKLINLPFNANGYVGLLYDTISLIHAFIFADIILYLGPGVGWFIWLKWIFQKKVIVNHGGINEWERLKLNKVEKWYAYKNHKLAAQYATINVVDNIQLQRNIKKYFGISSVIIKYGGNHVIRNSDNTNKLLTVIPFKKYAICIARAEPDNLLHLLLKVYSKLSLCNILLISNWDVSKYGRNLRIKYKKYTNIYLMDAIYDQIMIDYLRLKARVYIHTQALCGTSPSLVEAMTLGLPIISFDTEVNRETTKNKAYFFKNESQLKHLLTSLTDVELINNSKTMEKIADNDYIWQNIAESYKSLFDN